MGDFSGCLLGVSIMEGSYQAKPQNSLCVSWPREDSSKVTEEKKADTSSYRRASALSQDLSLHPDCVIVHMSLSLPSGKIRYCMGRLCARHPSKSKLLIVPRK